MCQTLAYGSEELQPVREDLILTEVDQRSDAGEHSLLWSAIPMRQKGDVARLATELKSQLVCLDSNRRRNTE